MRLFTGSSLLICILAGFALGQESKSKAAPKPTSKELIAAYDQQKFLDGFRTAAVKHPLNMKHYLKSPGSVSVAAVALSKDVSRLAVSYSDGTMIVYDVEKGTQVSELPKAAQGVAPSIAMSSDGKYVLLGGPAKRGGLVVKADNCEKVTAFLEPTSDIKKVAISADDKFAVLITTEGSIHRYPLLGGKGLGSEPFAKGKDCQFFCVAPDASWAAVGMDAFSPYRVVFFTKEETAVPLDMERLLDPIQFMASNEYFMSVARNQLWVTHRPPGRAFVPSRLRGENSFIGAVLPDDRCIFITDRVGHFELRSLEAPGLSWWDQNPAVDLTAATMGADARTIVSGYKGGFVYLLQMAAAPEINGLKEMRQLHALLEEKRYEDLEELVKAVEKDQTPLPWRANTSPISTFNQLLWSAPGLPNDGPDPSVLMEAWIKARPKADYPKLMLCDHYIRTAWSLRGSGFANTVRPEAWKGYYENMEKAEKLVVPICDQERPPPQAYRFLTTVAMGLGWPREKWQPYADRMKKEVPDYIEGHGQALTYLMPRWGGGPDECANYAKELADSIGGANGDIMYARLLFDKAIYYKNDKELLNESKMDGQRVLKGLLELSKSKSEKAFALHWGFRLAATGLQDKVQAKKFYDLVEENRLGGKWELGWWYNDLHINIARIFANRP